MASNEKEYKVVEPKFSGEPEIGRWLWALDDTRNETLREVERWTLEMLMWLPPDNVSSIWTILYHIADIEVDWLFVEVLEQSIPKVITDLFPYPTRDTQGHLTEVSSYDLDVHLARLTIVRSLLVEAFMKMDLADFRRVRTFEHYDVTPEWVIHHLIQHEAEHRGQLGSLRASAERHIASANA